MPVNGFLVNNAVQKYNYESLVNYNTPDFSTSSTYQVGDYVMYQGKLYKCITAITTGGAWDSTKWSLAILSDDVADLKSALDEAIEDFAVPTQEAVDNWLAAHPEATTTVLDGSLTEEKFSDGLKIKTVKDYVTPEMFGAVGNGVHDDTSSLQSAINYAQNHAKELVLSKRYNTTYNTITAPITVSGNGSILGYINVNTLDRSVSITGISFLNNTFGITITKAVGLVVKNCLFDGCDRAIYADNTDGIYTDDTSWRNKDSLWHTRSCINISNNQFKNCNYSVYVDYSMSGNDLTPSANRWMRSNDWIISKNVCLTSIITAFYILGIDGLILSENIIFNNADSSTISEYCVWIGKESWTRIVNNSFFENGYEAVYINTARQTTISNNHFAVTGTRRLACPIKLDHYDNVIISDNIFLRCSGQYAIYCTYRENYLFSVFNNEIIAGNPDHYIGVETLIPPENKKILYAGNETNIAVRTYFDNNVIDNDQLSTAKKITYVPTTQTIVDYADLVPVASTVEALVNGYGIEMGMPAKTNYYVKISKFAAGYTKIEATNALNGNFYVKLQTNGTWGEWTQKY